MYVSPLKRRARDEAREEALIWALSLMLLASLSLCGFEAWLLANLLSH